MLIKGILVRVDEAPRVVEFEESLSALQEFVGGYIEMVQLFDDEDVDVVINEEGKLIGLETNKVITHKHHILDYLAGDIIIVGANPETGETVSVPEDKISWLLDVFSETMIEI